MNWLTNAIIPRWAVTLGVIIICAGVWGSFYYWAYSNGVTSERERNSTVENIKLVEYGQRILELQTKAREDERASVKKVNELTVNYEKRIQDAQTKTKSALLSVATGTRQLRIGTKASVPASGSSAAKISTIAPTVTETSAELSREAAEFLINLTGECDATAEKLNLAIDIAEHDRTSTGSVSGSEMSTSIDLTNKEIDQ